MPPLKAQLLLAESLAAYFPEMVFTDSGITVQLHRNTQHYRLDVGMREDECRIRRQESGENLAVCRHIALNLLTEEKSFKAGVKRKQKRANRNNEYLSQVLAGRGGS